MKINVNEPRRLIQPAYFYFCRRTHSSPPPLYHITTSGASQAFQMLNFCYESVTKVLRKCYSPFMRQSLTAQDAPVIAADPYIIRRHKLQAGSCKSWNSVVASQKGPTSWKLETIYVPKLEKIRTTDFRLAQSCDIPHTIGNTRTSRKLEIRRSENTRLRQKAEKIKNQIFDFRANFMYNIYVKRKGVEV